MVIRTVVKPVRQRLLNPCNTPHDSGGNSWLSTAAQPSISVTAAAPHRSEQVVGGPALKLLPGQHWVLVSFTELKSLLMSLHSVGTSAGGAGRCERPPTGRGGGAE
jgi:hypothetical protein